MDGGMINEFRKSGQTIYNIEIKLHLSMSLAFCSVVIKQTQSGRTKAVEYIMDKSTGLNFMFDCNKIGNMMAGV